MARRPPREITVFAPATVANLGSGFDVLGLALDRPGDTVRARLGGKPGVRLLGISGDGGRLPRDPARNCATVPVLKLLAALGSGAGIEIELEKGLPLSSGLGSSSASAAAGAFAANELLGRPLSATELIPFAMEGEFVACGARHADNVGPALLGGLVLIRSGEPLEAVRLELAAQPRFAILHPAVEVDTALARRVLPAKIPLAAAVRQWGNVAGLVYGLASGDLALAARSLADGVAEPVRKRLIPHFDAVRGAALAAGALGFGISGSGPSMFALCATRAAALRACRAARAVYAAHGLACDAFVAGVNPDGPVIR